MSSISGIAAVFGYMTFLGSLQGDILVSYQESFFLIEVVNGQQFAVRDSVIEIVKFCFVCAVIVTVPLIHFPARKTLSILLFPPLSSSASSTVCCCAAPLRWRTTALKTRTLHDKANDRGGYYSISPFSTAEEDREGAPICPDEGDRLLSRGVPGRRDIATEGPINSLQKIADTGSEAGSDRIPALMESEAPLLSLPFHLGLTVIIIALVTTLAITVPGISYVFAVVGATSAVRK